MSDDTTTHLPVAGLDVHAASIRLAVVLRDEPLDERTLPFDCQLVERELRRLGATRVCYEADPTGPGGRIRRNPHQTRDNWRWRMAAHGLNPLRAPHLIGCSLRGEHPGRGSD